MKTLAKAYIHTLIVTSEGVFKIVTDECGNGKQRWFETNAWKRAEKLPSKEWRWLWVGRSKGESRRYSIHSLVLDWFEGGQKAYHSWEWETSPAFSPPNNREERD